jgi:hypothetical protein
MKAQDIQESIALLENSISVKNPHRMAEIAVEMSILLGNLSDCLAELESNYDELKTSELKREINVTKRFLKTRESTVKRIEHFLKNKAYLERNGA